MENGCHSAIFSQVNPKINSVVHDPTGFYENCLRTFCLISVTDRQTNPRTEAIIASLTHGYL